MTIKQQFNTLCPPAKLYLVISCIWILAIWIQNLREPNTYKVGSYKIPLHHHNVLFFIIKIVGMALWTWLLQFMCKKGYKGVSWFAVIIPYIIMFVMIGVVVVTGMEKKRAVRRPVYQQPSTVYAQPPVVYQQPLPVYQQSPVYNVPAHMMGPPTMPVRPQAIPIAPSTSGSSDQTGAQHAGDPDGVQKFNWKP